MIFLQTIYSLKLIYVWYYTLSQKLRTNIVIIINFSIIEETGELFFEASVKGSESVHIATLPVNLGSKFDAEEDIIFDEGGIVNSLNSEKSSIGKDRQAFIDDLLAEFNI